MFLVRRNDESENTLAYGVDLASRKCSCTRWEQMGVPCRHAVACIGQACKGEMNDSHFYEWTLSSFWKQLYEEVTSLCFVLPDTVGVARASDKLSKIAAGTTDKTVVLFAPTTTISSLAGKPNKKRIKSGGETGYTLASSTNSSAIVNRFEH